MSAKWARGMMVASVVGYCAVACGKAGVSGVPGTGGTAGATATSGGANTAGGDPGSGGAIGGEADAGTAGGTETLGNLCTPRALRPCEGHAWVDTQSGTCRYYPSFIIMDECEGEGFETIAECLEACDPDSVCLISPPESIIDTPCLPEIHGGTRCWFNGCTCGCQGDGDSALWICSC